MKIKEIKEQAQKELEEMPLYDTAFRTVLFAVFKNSSLKRVLPHKHTFGLRRTFKYLPQWQNP